MMDQAFLILGLTLLGTVVGSALALIPALHVYNVAGFVIAAQASGVTFAEPQQLHFVLLGMVVGYVFFSTLPGLFLAVPDESLAFSVLPAQQMIRRGEGYTAAMLTAIGVLGGVLVLLLLAPILPVIVRRLHVLVAPHLHWIIALIVVYMLMSEWPFSNGAGSNWDRMRKAWGQLLAGALTFSLSGIVGIILMYRSPIDLTVAYQNLLPAFVGFFAVPAVIQAFVIGGVAPKQAVRRQLDVTPQLAAQGVFAGALGGLFAAFFPLVTAGIGGFLAGHATAQRDARVFVISQGTSRFLYYVGAIAMFFLPGVGLTRGGLAAMLATLDRPGTWQSYWFAIGAIAISAAFTFLLFERAAWLTALLAPRLPQRILNGLTLVVLLGVVFISTRWAGLTVMAVCTCIGSLPLLWKTRRMHCLGVILIPVLINMLGWDNWLLQLF